MSSSRPRQGHGRSRAARLLSAALALGCVPGVASADVPRPTAAAERPDHATFQLALDAVARAAPGTCIIAEGSPLASGTVVPAGASGERPAAAVARIAAAGDYSVERVGATHVFLLRKCHTDPRDLPDVTLEECRAVLSDVSRVLAAHDPKIPWDDRGVTLARELFASLSEARRVEMVERGLRIGDLTPAQRGLVRRTALHLCVRGPAEGVRRVLARADHFFAADPALRVGEGLIRKGRRHFGYDATGEATAGADWDGFTPRGGPGVVSFGGAMAVMEHDIVLRGKDGRLLTPGDPDAPTAADIASAAVPEAGMTLAALVAALDRRSAAAGGPHLAVAPEVAGKVVTVAGADACEPAEALSALAQLYGLRVAPEAGGRLRLERPAVPTPTDPARIGEAVRAAVPDPVRRLLRFRNAGAGFVTIRMAAMTPDGRPRPFTAEEDRRWAQGQARRDALGDLLRPHRRPAAVLPGRVRTEAVRRLRAGVAARASAGASAMEEVPGERVRLSALGAGERRALALVLLLQGLETVRPWLSPEPPRFLAGFEDARVTGRADSTGAETRYSLGVYSRIELADGTVIDRYAGEVPPPRGGRGGLSYHLIDECHP